MLVRVHNKKITRLIIAGMCAVTLSAPLVTIANPMVHAAEAYDLSQFQGYLTPSKVKALKKEVGFVILRVQYGSNMKDAQIQHNIKLMNRYHLPYGVYSYSLYANPAQARGEAETLVHRAPKAKFFVNDIERDNTDGTLNSSTKAWASEIHKLSSRPAVLYSGLYFMNTNLNQNTRNKYNAIWLAAYGAQPDPSYHYDLWQFADNTYSKALGESLDGDDFPENSKPLSFWIGNSTNQGLSKKRRSTIKPLNPATKQATNMAKKAAQSKTHGSERYYKNKAKEFAQQADTEANQLAQLRNAYKEQGMALQSDANKLKDLQNRLSNIQTKLNKASNGSSNPTDKDVNLISRNINPSYYRSFKVTHVKVTAKNGVNCYNFNGKKLAHIRKGAIVHVIGFQYIKHGTHYITKAIVDYDWKKDGSPRRCIMTSNKNFVHKVNYSD